MRGKKIRKLPEPPPAYLSGNLDWAKPLIENQKTEAFQVFTKEWQARARRKGFKLVAQARNVGHFIFNFSASIACGYFVWKEINRGSANDISCKTNQCFD